MSFLFNNIKSSSYANYTLFNEHIAILIFFISHIYNKGYKLSFHEGIMKGVLKFSHLIREEMKLIERKFSIMI